MADSDNLAQDEIDRLLGEAAGGGPQAAAAKSAPDGAPRREPAAPPPPTRDSAPVTDDADIQALFRQAEQAIDSVDHPVHNEVPGLGPFQYPDLGQATVNGDKASLDLLSDVELDLRIELGRTHMYLEDILQLRKGSVVSLDKLAGDPVDIYVNGRLIARGEVLVLSETFCVRVGELISSADEN